MLGASPLSQSDAEMEPLQSKEESRPAPRPWSERPKTLPVRPRMVPRRMSLESDSAKAGKPMPQANSLLVFSVDNR